MVGAASTPSFSRKRNRKPASVSESQPSSSPPSSFSSGAVRGGILTKSSVPAETMKVTPLIRNAGCGAPRPR
jgi:hypothetical protein